MQIAVEVKGLSGLVKDFNSAPPKVKRELNTAINLAGVRIQREAKIEAPVRTGNLRSQIRFSNLADGRGVVGSYAQYSIYVHEGTRFQRANPFMERAVDQSRNDLALYFERAVSNIGKHLAEGK